MDRPFDLVVYGATGFTGRLASRYVAQSCPTTLKWAIGGRSQSKLEAIVGEIQALNVNRKPPGIVIADSADAHALADLAKSTRVVVSTAGPFAKHGSLLVQACAENGTHYADITGETVWAREIVQKWHCKPAQSPSIIIPSCGVDSIPSDLGTALVIEALQQKYGSVGIKYARGAVTELKGEFSGGSFASMTNMMEMYPIKALAAAIKPFGLSSMAPPSNPTPQSSITHDDRLGGWLGPWIMGPTNRAVVGRTYGLLGGEWGQKFSYREYRNYGSWFMCQVNALGLQLMGLCLGIPPLRWVVSKVVPPPGSGPSDETMRSGKYAFKVIAETDEPQPKLGSVTISTEQDVAYLLTAMMLVEAGLTLAHDVKKTKAWELFFKNGERQSVVLTPAMLGDILKDRVHAGGVHFSEVEL